MKELLGASGLVTRWDLRTKQSVNSEGRSNSSDKERQKPPFQLFVPPCHGFKVVSPYTPWIMQQVGLDFDGQSELLWKPPTFVSRGLLSLPSTT